MTTYFERRINKIALLQTVQTIFATDIIFPDQHIKKTRYFS